jgi:DNA-binding transcriptional ArsR family regulator
VDVDETDPGAVARLRATAHPLRLRMLSLLTAEAMSAAEVARALDLTHANASYHLRVLLDADQLVVVGEEKVRGGVAKRYRYDATRSVPTGSSGSTDRIADARAAATEIERRLLEVTTGPSYYGDLETWVPVEAFRRALSLMQEASAVLHEEARPAGTPDTVHLSATIQAFTMSGGLRGEDAR